MTKFRRCASLVPPPESVERCIDLVEGLDKSTGLQELIHLLSTASADGVSP